MTARRIPVSVVLLHGPPDRVTALTDSGIDVLGVVGSAREAVDARPDVVVVDLDGPDALAAVGEVSDRRPVLAVSTSGAHADVLAAVRAGAIGYVVDEGRPWDVADAVTRLVNGESAFSPGLAAVVLEARGGPAADEAHLTERESDVLRLVVEGLTARQVATRLGLSPRTVENHVQSLLRKLPVTNRAALVRYAIEHGLA